MKSQEIVEAAQTVADNYVCICGRENAERILKLAWEKVKVKNVLLQEKYGEEKR